MKNNWKYSVTSVRDLQRIACSESEQDYTGRACLRANLAPVNFGLIRLWTFRGLFFFCRPRSIRFPFQWRPSKRNAETRRLRHYKAISHTGPAGWYTQACLAITPRRVRGRKQNAAREPTTNNTGHVFFSPFFSRQCRPRIIGKLLSRSIERRPPRTRPAGSPCGPLPPNRRCVIFTQTPLVRDRPENHGHTAAAAAKNTALSLNIFRQHDYSFSLKRSLPSNIVMPLLNMSMVHLVLVVYRI